MTHIKLTNIDASYYLKFKIENGKLKVMKKLFLIIILALFFNVNGQQTTDNIGIIPMPQQVEINDGHFILNESTVIFDNFEISSISFSGIFSSSSLQEINVTQKTNNNIINAI